MRASPACAASAWIRSAGGGSPLGWRPGYAVNEIASLLILLGLSAFFSGSETALTSLSLARAEGLVKDGRAGARAVLRLKRNTTRMLVIILIGNNVVNIGASALATVIATERFGHLGPGIAVGLLTIVILVFGEVMPKSWAARHREKVSLLAAPVILLFGRLVFPLVWAMEHFTSWLHAQSGVQDESQVTEAELLSMVQQGADEGSIEPGEQQMIERALAFNDVRVQDVMTPRREVFSLDGHRTIQEAVQELMQQSYSRVPVFLGDPDDVRKVVHLREILKAIADGQGGQQVITLGHEPIFVPESQPIDELFALLRCRSRHLALAVDEHGTLVGVVTLEDLLEELVGEIYDETDQPESHLWEVAAGRIAVEGGAELRLIEEYFDLEGLSGRPTDSAGGWVVDHAERIPGPGEEFLIDGLRVHVVKASKRRVQLLEVSRSRAHEAGDARASELDSAAG